MYSENISTSDNKISKIKHLINFEYTYFHSKDFSFDNFTNYLDYFKNPDYEKDFDCFRFNAVTNKSVKLFETSSTAEFYGVTLKTSTKKTFLKMSIIIIVFLNHFIVFLLAITI